MLISSTKQRLLIFIVVAIIIDYIPLVNMPFLWSETFFHEISHGLAALLTGGNVHSITLNFNGSGVCRTSGGERFIVSFSGYAGSTLWGYFIYSIADSSSNKKADFIVSAIVMLLVITLLLWARDIPSVIILSILLAMYLLPLYKSLWFSVKSFIQLVGVFVMLDAIRSPLYLLDGHDKGDGATLAALTWLPEFFWVALWLGIAVSGLYIMWTRSSKR